MYMYNYCIYYKLAYYMYVCRAYNNTQVSTCDTTADLHIPQPYSEAVDHFTILN